MTEKKKMNTYLKYGLLLLVFVIVGGILGYSIVGVEGGLLTFGAIVQQGLYSVRKYLLAILLIFTVFEVVLGEWILSKMKRLAKKLKNAEEEERDCIDYEMEKLSAIGNGGLGILYFLSIVALSIGYSMEYIKEVADSFEGVLLLVGFVVFVGLNIYFGFWGVRLIKFQQKIEPRLQGDPASIKFTEQWVESCDEVEKERIYQSAFQSYVTASKWSPMIIMLALITHFIWNTGIAAVIFTGIIWLILNLSYLKHCLRKMKQKLVR